MKIESIFGIKEGKKFHCLRYMDKQLRVAKRRRFEETFEFRDRYRWRSGIEGTFSKYKRLTGVEKLRVRGLVAVRFCAVLKALALNIFRATAVKMAYEGNNTTGPGTVSVPLRVILFVKEHFSVFMQILEDVFDFWGNYLAFSLRF